VPIDLGGTADTSIAVTPYRELRECLGLPVSPIYVADIVQQQVLVDEDVRRRMPIDTVGVQYEPAAWRTDTITYGFPVEFPARFLPRLTDDGSQVLLDSDGNVLLKFPKGGDFFYPLHSALASATSIAEIDLQMDAIASFDRPAYLDMSYEELGRKAKALYEQTDYLVIGFFGAHIFAGGQFLRGFESFLLDLIANPKLAEAVMDRLLQANMSRFERYAETVGKYVHVIHVEDDLGMQDAPFLSLELYRKMVKPYHAKIYGFIKSKCNVPIVLHSDGAISQFIPDLIEAGVDALNPVQVSARGMDTKKLKKEFGQDIAFWGGACDSQSVLPFGTPQQVRDEVKRRIDDLAPGGGYVLASIHNICPGVPVENIAALFEAAYEYGAY